MVAFHILENGTSLLDANSVELLLVKKLHRIFCIDDHGANVGKTEAKVLSFLGFDAETITFHVKGKVFGESVKSPCLSFLKEYSPVEGVVQISALLAGDDFLLPCMPLSHIRKNVFTLLDRLFLPNSDFMPFALLPISIQEG